MKNDKIIASWNKIEPSDSANERMLSAILERNRSVRKGKDKVKEMSKTKKWLIPAAVCLALLAAVIIPIINNTSSHIPLSRASSGVTVSYAKASDSAYHSVGSLIPLTEDELFTAFNTVIFEGTVTELNNIVVDCNGMKNYWSIAEIKVSKSYRGNVNVGDTVSVRMNFPISETEFAEDTETLSHIRVGMKGIFMPTVYDSTSIYQENGATLALKDIADFGFADGVRYAFLETSEGLLFDRQSYTSISEAKTLDEIEEYILSKTEQYGNTTGNISNNAFAAQDGENLYYLRETDPYAQVITYELVKSPIDGDTESVIFSGDKLSYLNVSDGWIYFIGGIDGQVYRMREDGSDYGIVTENLTGINAMVVVNNYIYCRAMDGDRNKTLYSINIETGEVDILRQMGQLCGGLIVNRGWVYYSVSENGKWITYRTRTDGTENEAIGDLYLYSACIEGDRIYYIDDNQQIRSMGLDGGDNTLLADGISAVRINPSEGWIYYTDTSAIYKIRTDGTEKTKLRDFPSGSNIDLNVLGDWIYLRGDGFEDQVISTEGSDVTAKNVVHEGSPSVPAEADVMELRAAVLEGMSEDEIFRLTDFIKAANLRFENAWFYNDIFGKLSDPENVYWTYFDMTGEIQIGWAESDGETSAVFAYNNYDAEFFINTMTELKDTVVSGMLDEDMDRLIDLCSKAKETRKVEYVIEMYHMLHDMDYFLLRYGPVDVGKYVVDASTISKFYDSLSIWKSFGK